MRGALKKRYHLFSHKLLLSNITFLSLCLSVSLSLSVCVWCVCDFLIYTICVFIFCVSQEGLSFTESNEPILWLLKVSNFWKEKIFLTFVKYIFNTSEWLIQRDIGNCWEHMTGDVNVYFCVSLLVYIQYIFCVCICLWEWY